MGPVLQSCRSRKASELEDWQKKSDQMTRFDRELNKLSDDDQSEKSNPTEEASGSDEESNADSIECDITDQRIMNVQSLG